MKRKILIGAAAVALLALLVVAGRLIARLPVFQVRRIELVGARFLTPSVVARALALRSHASVFDPVAPLERRAAELPGILSARITRRLPGTLRVAVREAEPVALAERSGRLVLVDGAGQVLPFDPTRPALDLPLGEPDSTVAGVLARVRDTDPDLFGNVQKAERFKRDVALDLPAGRILFRAGASSEDIRSLLLVAGYLARKGRTWRELDARYIPRVIVRGAGS